MQLREGQGTLPGLGLLATKTLSQWQAIHADFSVNDKESDLNLKLKTIYICIFEHSTPACQVQTVCL